MYGKVRIGKYLSDNFPIQNGLKQGTKEMRDIIDYCQSRKKQLIIGWCHILWGSTSTNLRGESLLEFLVSSNLNILNHGNEPIFVVCNRKEVIDFSIGTNKIRKLVIGMYLVSHLFRTTDTYCTMLGFLNQFWPPAVHVSPLKTPFGLLIPLLQSQSHVTTITHNYFLRCYAFTQLILTRSWLQSLITL
jgi:hypothetical protein